MKIFSFEFKLFIFFIISQILLLFLSVLEVTGLTLSIIFGLLIIFFTVICYIIHYKKKLPPLLIERKTALRAFSVIFSGSIFLATVYLFTGGINQYIFPFFISAIGLIFFSALESFGLVRTYESQSVHELYKVQKENIIIKFIWILCVLWAFIPLFGSILYRPFPEMFNFLESFEFPFSSLEGAVADSNGNIYIDIGSYGRIQKYDRDGNFLYGFSYGNVGSAELIIDCNDRLYTGSYGKENILKIFSSEGKLIEKLSEPDEALTSWYLCKGGKVEILTNEKIVINETAFPVKEENYLFTSTKFYKKIFQDLKNNKYMISKNFFYPSVRRKTPDGKTDLIIKPHIFSYLFTMPFPGLIIPVFIMFLTMLLTEKKERKEQKNGQKDK